MHQSQSEHDSSSSNNDNRPRLTRLKRHTGIPITRTKRSRDDYKKNHQQRLLDEHNAIPVSRNQKDNQPIKRATSRALKQQLQSQSVPVSKGPTRYKKKQNEGNILVEEARIKAIFKEICNSDGVITVDSLGHSLQKHHIEFDLRDISEMIGLLWMLKEESVPADEDDRMEQDEKGEFNLSLKLGFKQFEQLFGLLRSKKL